MQQQLIGEKEVAHRLGISHRTFQRYKPRMIARGLRQIRGERRIMFVSSDVDRLIQKAAETGELLAPVKREKACQQ